MGRMKLPSFFDGSEGLLDGVEVGAVRWERQERMTCGLEKILDLFFVVEAGVVHDDDAGLMQLQQEVVCDPLVDGFGFAGVFKKQRR